MTNVSSLFGHSYINYIVNVIFTLSVYYDEIQLQQSAVWSNNSNNYKKYKKYKIVSIYIISFIPNSYWFFNIINLKTCIYFSIL